MFTRGTRVLTHSHIASEAARCLVGGDGIWRPKVWRSWLENHWTNKVSHDGSMYAIYIYIYWLVVLNIFYFPIILWRIIPTDFHIFQRGGSTTNQSIYGNMDPINIPPMSVYSIYIPYMDPSWEMDGEWWDTRSSTEVSPMFTWNPYEIPMKCLGWCPPNYVCCFINL